MNATLDNTLANPERRIADLERQLAECKAELAECKAERDVSKAERDEALQREAATAEVLQVINSSPGNLTPVFEAMLEKAIRLCGGDRGALWTIEGGRGRLAAARGLPAEFVTLLRERGESGTNWPLQRVVQGEWLIEFPDTVEVFSRSGDPHAKGAVEAGVRSAIWVAIVKEGVAVGAFTIGRSVIGTFSDKQIALLQNFAAQAVIAMENARLLTETREALEQQTATAEVLGVINSSPGDLAPVFDAILEKAHSLCDAPLGSLVLRDGDQLRAVATRGYPQKHETFARQGFPPTQAFRLFLSGERFVQVLDASEPPTAFEGDPLRRTLVEAGVRTALFVPLRKDETVLGYISAQRQEVRPFTDRQIALLESFAAQAVIAMENARLITETREALEQQTATAEVLQVINASPGDLAPVFDAMLERAIALCEASFGSLQLWDGERMLPIAERGFSAELRNALRWGETYTPPQGSWIERLVHGENVVSVADVMGNEMLRNAPRIHAVARLDGARSMIWVALRKDDTLVGIINVYRKEVRPFSDKQIALLQNFAAQAVIAVENARLLDELRQRTDEVAELNRGLEARVAEQVEELGRVGRLKRFLAPQLAELIVSQGDEKILESHRREIVVVFCDLRGYTSFSETAEPEEVLDFLRDYHGALGPLVAQFEGTLDQFSGDGIMVFFNDPVACADPAERAVKMAMAMRDAAGALLAKWRRRGRELGFGVGIAQGYATLGQIGFAERSGYTAIGTVCNLAARLCAEAKDGQILVAQRVAIEVEKITTLEEIGALALKGLTQPVVAYNVPLGASQPALRIIEGGPQSQ